MQQKIAPEQKVSKGESLCLLAQRAREGRGEAPSAATQPTKPGAMTCTLAGDDSGSRSGSGSESGGGEEAAWIRGEKRQQREPEMRMSNMGQKRHAKHFAREQNRDISEKIALGLAKPTMSQEHILDSRLFKRDSMSGSFRDEESYNLYDKHSSVVLQQPIALYKSRGNTGVGNDKLYGGGAEEGVANALSSDRFGLGPTKLGRGPEDEGGPGAEGPSERLVQFEEGRQYGPDRRPVLGEERG